MRDGILKSFEVVLAGRSFWFLFGRGAVTGVLFFVFGGFGDGKVGLVL